MDSWEKKKTENNLKSILVTTFKSAKGLEFDTVIMPDFQNAISSNKNDYYVGCTRAKSYLFVLCLHNVPQLINQMTENSYELFEGEEISSVEEDEPQSKALPNIDLDDDLPF